jgi:DNA polymerase-3 subunit delta'
MTLAMNLGQAVNCEEIEPPCGQCNSCLKIMQQKHADVHLIGLINNDKKYESRKNTEISIEQIRRIQHSANLPPFEGRYRLYIIDGAEFLSLEAANCLLKTLEEPFKRVLFILLAQNITNIPETVISRCQKLEMIPLSASEVEKELVSQWGVEREKAKILARICKGCIGWAISALKNDELIRRYGEDRENLINMVQHGYQERFTYAAQLAKEFSLRRETTIDILNMWLDLWHDLMFIKVGFREAIINIDIEERLSELAEKISFIDIVKFIKNIQLSSQNLRFNVNPRLALEVLMMDIPLRTGKSR